MKRTFFFLSMAAVLWAMPALLEAGLPSRVHDFAQIADGGGFRTIILVMNQNGAAVSVTIKFFDDSGAPRVLTLESTTDSTFTFAIPAGGSRTLKTPGTSGTVKTGWARLSATGEVGAQVIFQTGSGSTVLSQAAVESSGPVDFFDIFVNEEGTSSNISNTGFAVANLSGSNAILVRLTFIDETGAPMGTNDIVIPALGHTASFIFEKIPAAQGKRGRLRVQTTGPVAVVALQVIGPALGSLPVVIVFV